MVSTRRVAIVFLRVGGCDGGRDAATVPRRSRSGCAEPPCELAEDGTIGTCGGQVDTDAGATTASWFRPSLNRTAMPTRPLLRAPRRCSYPVQANRLPRRSGAALGAPNQLVQSIKPFSPSPNHGEFATATMSGLLPHSRA